MSLTEDTDNFRAWATNLGCPTNALPNEEALISIFKSRQRDLFCDLQKRVQPRQYVQETRENILIKKVEKMKDKVVPACSRSFLPKEMQIHFKMQELTKRKENAKVALEDVQKEFDTLSASIKTKNIQSISAAHNKKILESKYNILQFKKEHLNKLYEQEEQNKHKILTTMPVKLSLKNANEQLAMNSVLQALKELEQFYQLCNSSGNTSLPEAKQELWQKMRTIFANVPNFLIFNCIMKLKEEQLQHIMKLNKTNADESLSKTTVTSKEPLNAFEVKLLKTKADLLGLVAKYLSARNEVAQLEDRFSDAYGTFVDELQKKVNTFNAVTDEDSTEEIISDFILQYNLRNFNKARNEYLTQQIEQFRSEIEVNAKHLENHEVLLSSIKQVYGDINTSVNRIQYEMMQLTQIKEKILYSKNILKNMLKDLEVAAQNVKAKSNLLSSKLLGSNLSLSLLGVDSFEMSNDILCSTKLDFDANMSVMNSTVRRSFGGCTNATVGDTTLMAASGAVAAPAGVPTLPSHLLELNTFNEMPLEKLSCNTRLSSFYIAPNPFIVESRELASTIQLAPGLLLTPFGAIKEVHQRILWASAIAAQKADFKLNLDAIIANSHEYKAKLKQQHEKISQLLDSIDVTTINTKHMLQKAERIYKFILENPMRHFIPPTRTYNNLTYADYEAEFIMYYRMATVGGSIK